MARTNLIDILDISLNTIKSASVFNDRISSEISEENSIDRKIIARAWKKLVTDGYLYEERTERESGDMSIRYYITIEGLLAIERCPFWRKGRPYKWQEDKKILKIIWRIITTTAIIANAIIVLVFTYLTYASGKSF